MQKIFTLICLLLFWGTSGARAWFTPDTVTTAGKPQLTFVNNDTAYDFGGMPKSASIENQFEIRNTGTVPLVITAMKCESANVKCRWPGKSIKPGKKGYITITYTANGDEGSFMNDIFITSNATGAPYPFLHIRGAITPFGSPMMPGTTPKSKGGRGRRGSGG